MKNLLTSTAIAAALAMPAFAESHAAAKADDMQKPWVMSGTMEHDGDHKGAITQPDFRASTLIGMRVYTTETDSMDERRVQSDANTEWNDVGEVNDILLSRNGELEAVLLDIGGFLGIGEKPVAVKMNELRFVADEDDPGDFFIVFTASAKDLEDAPAFDLDRLGGWAAQEVETKDDMPTFRERAEATRAATDAMGDDDASMTEETADADKADDRETDMAAKTDDGDADMADATDEEPKVTEGTDPDAENGDQVVATAENDEGRPVLMAPEVDRDGYGTAKIADLTASDVTGAVVYDINDESIGEVSDLVITDSGDIKQAIIDVGGFLGIGEKSVAVDMESLTIKRASDGSDLRVYVNATEAKFDQMEEWDG